MARQATVENAEKVVEILKDVMDKGGYRRLEAPYSYYMVKRLRDQGYIRLQETVKTAVKGKNPFLYVVTDKGEKLVTVSDRTTKLLAKKAKARAERATAKTVETVDTDKAQKQAEARDRKNAARRAKRAAVKAAKLEG